MANPDFEALANAYRFRYSCLTTNHDVDSRLADVIDGGESAEAFRQSAGADERRAQVQALGAGVDFHGHAALRRRSRDLFEIKREGFPMQQNAAGGVAHDLQRRAFQGSQETVRHLSGLQIHVTVDASDDDVQFGERRFIEVH